MLTQRPISPAFLPRASAFLNLIPGLCWMLFSGASGAATIFTDNFDDLNDDGWNHADSLSSVPGYPFQAGYDASAGNYTITSNRSADTATLGASRAGSFPAGTYSAFTSSVDVLIWEPNSWFGIAGRAHDVGLGTTDGYLFHYQTAIVGVDVGPFPVGPGQFHIDRIDNEGLENLVSLEYTLDSDKDYRFTFSGNGDALNAEVFELGNLASPLVSLVTADGTYASGNSGLFVASLDPAGAPTSTTFDNFSATVPEPSVILLFASTVPWLLLGRRRRTA